MTTMSEAVLVSPKRVSVSTIRDELHALWAAEALGGDTVIRARTHNLIVYTADAVSANETTRQVIESTVERPGRVIVIDTEPGTRPLDAWVTTYCRKIGSQQICGEMITLTIGAERQDEVASTVISLLAPDLPVNLWWRTEPVPSNPLFMRLALEAGRLIVDSDTFVDPALGLQRLISLADEIRTSDMAWARLTEWRRLLAQAWDSPTCRASLRQIRSLTVDYAVSGDPPNEARALLLIGWLSRSLDWKIISAVKDKVGTYLMNFRHGRRDGRAMISRTERGNTPASEIVRVLIDAEDHRRQFTLRLELMAEKNLVETYLDEAGPDAQRLVNAFHPVDLSTALVDELDLGYDPEYGEALQGACELLGKIIM